MGLREKIQLQNRISLFDPAEINEKIVGFSEGPCGILPAVEESVARTVIADQLAWAACVLHHALESDNAGIGNCVVRLAMEKMAIMPHRNRGNNILTRRSEKEQGWFFDRLLTATGNVPGAAAAIDGTGSLSGHRVGRDRALDRDVSAAAIPCPFDAGQKTIIQLQSRFGNAPTYTLMEFRGMGLSRCDSHGTSSPVPANWRKQGLRASQFVFA